MIESLEDREVPSVNWIGDASGNWSNSGNWFDTSNSTNHVPGATDDVVFNGSHTGAATVDTAFTVKSLTITSGYTSDITLSNAVTLPGGSLSGGAIAVSGGTVDFNVTTANSATIPTGATLKMSGGVTALLGLALSGTLEGVTGTNNWNNGSVTTTAQHTGPNPDYSPADHYGTTADDAGLDPEVNSPGLTGTDSFTTTNPVLGTLSAGTLQADSGATLQLGVTLGGAGGLTKTGTGTAILTGTDNYGGTTAVNAGTLLVNGSITTATTVANGGTLGGTGTVSGSVTESSGAIVNPGVTTGTLRTGNYSQSGGALNITLNGTGAGSFDQLAVTGSVNLNGPLNLTVGYTPTVGNTFVIINNDGTADPVGGTFTSLPEGSPVVVGSNTFVISYKGGDGNDVVLKANFQPTGVSAGGTYTINEGQSLSLSASATDPDGDTLTYSWDINGDGTFGDATGASPTLTWAQLGALSPAINDNGTFNVSVQVSDGITSPVTSTATTLTVVNVDPTIAISGASSVNEGATYTLNLSATGDPGADTISQWDITWGDGSPVQTVTGNPSSVTHVFADGPNNWTISATATDEDGTYAAGSTVAVQVDNVAPTIAISGASSVNEGATYTLNLSATGDPGADTISQWDITWGDGSPVQTVTGNPSSVTHVFTDNGTPTISATATDEDGTYAAGNTVSVTVNNVAPSAAGVTGPAFLALSTVGNFSLSGVFDPSSVDTAAPLHYSFATSPGGLAADYGTAVTNNSFDFSSPTLGTFTIYGRVYDKDGGVSSTYSTTVTVNAGSSFDMKASVSAPAVEGWKKAWQGTQYSATMGYGWSRTSSVGGGTGGVVPPGGNTAVMGDYAYGTTAATFQVYVGAYQSASVNIYSYGTAAQGRPGVAAKIGTGPTSTLTTNGVLTISGTAGADGILNITFNRGTGKAMWVVSAIEVSAGEPR